MKRKKQKSTGRKNNNSSLNFLLLILFLVFMSIILGYMIKIYVDTKFNVYKNCIYPNDTIIDNLLDNFCYNYYEVNGLWSLNNFNRTIEIKTDNKTIMQIRNTFEHELCHEIYYREIKANNQTYNRTINQAFAKSCEFLK